jgi:hypothetical protein
MTRDSNVTERYALLTNLDYVILGGVRTYTHALLVVREKEPLDERRPRYQLRGFLTHSSLPVFDSVVPSDEFELVPAHSDQFWVESEAEDGRHRPLFRGAILRIAGAPDVHLIAEVNSSDPIDVHRFPEETDVATVWRLLEEKVAAHWTGPNMPLPHWVPAEAVRTAHRRAK